MEKPENENKEFIDLPPDRGHTRVYLSKGQVILHNFLGGIAWGVGTVIGATVIVAILFFILNRIDTIPIIGNFIGRIIEEIQAPGIR